MRRLALPLILAAGACVPAGVRYPEPVAPYDLIIEGGRVVDGTGNPWFHGDVAVQGDRVVRVAPAGLLRDTPAHERVDARGKVVAPGFIDIISHSRAALLDGDGRVLSKVTQGITTEIMGESTSNAPANELTVGDVDLSDPDVRERATRFFGPRGFDTWLRAMDATGMSVNGGSFVGGGTLRRYGKGMAQGAPTPAELDTMRAAMVRAMEDGAFGLATSLIYAPGNFATTAELIEISRAMAPYGGLYITHLRSEGDRWLEALDEAIQIGTEGGVPVEIYHLKAAGQRNWRLTEPAIARIDSARRAGLDVTADMYPYPAAGTGLTSCLPAWAAADGRLFHNLRDPDMRARIRDEMVREYSDWENFCILAGPEGVMVVGLEQPENERWIGRRLSEVAHAQDKHWADAAIDLILSEEDRVFTMYFLMSDENVALKMRQPWISFGTDAGGVDPDSARGLVHPRAYGTYPRILGKYVRDEAVISLEDAVRKASSAVAQRLGIRDRGLLREGMYADIVVFDPGTIHDRATYEEPHQLSVGVRHVFVNGVAVIRHGEHTGALPGRIVRGPGYTPAPR